ncbi:hypothetical protein BRADI_1g07693v3 [Brachypodium distachyon]|uniref:Uncharacterized protein n=1 Tax=Brachypodium distachyon TaxID=15368 RepID=A0A2K2DII3_BRADI|nr:hypothetical protein BRADI_1g07693v3 [Brachypodium distachyon]PNT74091.1 hypothetical protein BRADI_1g07693v3 [Brachypodium distachyon]
MVGQLSTKGPLRSWAHLSPRSSNTHQLGISKWCPILSSPPRSAFHAPRPLSLGSERCLHVHRDYLHPACAWWRRRFDPQILEALTGSFRRRRRDARHVHADEGSGRVVQDAVRDRNPRRAHPLPSYFADSVF